MGSGCRRELGNDTQSESVQLLIISNQQINLILPIIHWAETLTQNDTDPDDEVNWRLLIDDRSGLMLDL